MLKIASELKGFWVIDFSGEWLWVCKCIDAELMMINVMINDG